MYLINIKSEIRNYYSLARCISFSIIFSIVALSVTATALSSPALANTTAIISNVSPANSATLSAPLNMNIKNYKEWKTAMIIDSENRIKNLKESLNKNRQTANINSADIAIANSEGGLSKDLNQKINQSVNHLQILVEKEEQQLSVAKELSISDYFVGYLTKQKSLSNAIKDVSGRLSADEVAELMQAYAELIK